MHVLLVLVMLAAAQLALAEPRLQSHESILTAIRQHLESNFRQPEAYELELPALSQRLQLPQCSRSLEVFRHPGSQEVGHVSVGVRCNGLPAWTIYHRAYVRTYREVAVLRRVLRQGEIIADQDLIMERKDVAQLHGGGLSREEALGKPARISIPAGVVLQRSHLGTIKLIRRNQSVAITARNPGYEITMGGIALMDGERGQRIRVRNQESKRVVEGVVVDNGIVSVMD